MSKNDGIIQLASEAKKQILNNPDIFASLNISQAEAEKLTEQIVAICFELETSNQSLLEVDEKLTARTLAKAFG